MNPNTFRSSTPGKKTPPADCINAAGGRSYTLPPKEALTQLVLTGTFNDIFYASGNTVKEAVLELCRNEEISLEFIAKLAVFARKNALMKDSPALLCGVLAATSDDAVSGLPLLKKIFPVVIDTGKMLRNFVQVIRSGVTGRKSLGSGPKKLIIKWFNDRTDEGIFQAATGNNPSLEDIIKLVHPRPLTSSRNALYGYLLGKLPKEEDLPKCVQDFEAFKLGQDEEVPKLPFERLAALNLDLKSWVKLAKTASWQAVRMNLATFERHGVLNVPGMVELLAQKLENRDAIKTSGLISYQLLGAYQKVVTPRLKLALQNVLEISLENVPTLEGQIVIGIDVSSSMRSPITGTRKGSTSKITCIEVAGLFGSALLHNNPTARIIGFNSNHVDLNLNPKDSVMLNIKTIKDLCHGGTEISVVFRYILDNNIKVDVIIIVSDNQSWFLDSGTNDYLYNKTEAMELWRKVKRRNPSTKAVCINIQPYATAQIAPGEKDVLHVGGFSDAVFKTLAGFVGGKNTQSLVKEVEEDVVL